MTSVLPPTARIVSAPGPAEQAIVAEAAVELVAPAAAAQDVVAAPALELVVAVAAGEAVVAGAAEERVVVVAAVEPVRAARAPSRKSSPPPPLDDVGALRAEDPLRPVAGQAAPPREVAVRQQLVGGGAHDELGVERDAEAVQRPSDPSSDGAWPRSAPVVRCSQSVNCVCEPPTRIVSSA